MGICATLPTAPWAARRPGGGWGLGGPVSPPIGGGERVHTGHFSLSCTRRRAGLSVQADDSGLGDGCAPLSPALQAPCHLQVRSVCLRGLSCEWTRGPPGSVLADCSDPTPPQPCACCRHAPWALGPVVARPGGPGPLRPADQKVSTSDHSPKAAGKHHCFCSL